MECRLSHFPKLQIAILSLFICVHSATPSLSTDKEALISFKSLTKTKSSDPLFNWAPHQSSPCNWTGVICNALRDRVVELDLDGLGLTGPISPHIGNLSFLESLQLQGNQLTGTLPQEIGNLLRLQIFNASSNLIQGPIPSTISNCKELLIIDLMQNEISGQIPDQISSLKKLQVLQLGRNKLYGPIPQSIANLSSLTTLKLGTNRLSGAIPDELGRLRSLKELDLTINSLSGTVPDSVYNMTSLVSLALASNDLWGDLPSNVGVTLPNLLVFNFCINKFTGTIPGSLHNLTNIRVIRMAHNLLHGTVPPGLGNLPNLEMYNIGYNNIVDDLNFLTPLTNSTKLNFLAIDGNKLEGVIPDSIGSLSKDLQKLFMGQNRIYGNIPASIYQLTNLALLNLSYNSISGIIPREIGQLKELQVLTIARNHISGSIPESLGTLKRLTELDLSGNHLVGNIPKSVGNLRSLLSMDLSNNELNGSIPKELLNLPSLSSNLNLSKNSLTGPLPQEIGDLESVVKIDLSNNHLFGTIPDSIDSCKSLEELFMSENQFSGNIPNTLGALMGLEVLDLSSNKLSGSIPLELQNIKGMQLLNLSFNDLEGVVPRTGIFKNLSIVHLEGNPNLSSKLAGDDDDHGPKRLILLCTIIPIVAILALSLITIYWLPIRRGKSNVTVPSEYFKGQHQMVSYDELRIATENFNENNLVGQGSFGHVFKGYLKDGLTVAVKVLDMERNGSEKSFLAECIALRNVRHRNLVKLITSCSSIDFRNMNFLALVYEFMSNGSLEDWISKKKRHENGGVLNVIERLNLAIDVACAVEYLHNGCETPIVHCDLKPSNILLDEDMTAKVGDFGLARLLMETSATQHSVTSTHALRGSIGYIPPEYGVGKKASTAGDVYSYGIMLLELYTGKSPTHDNFEGGLSLRTWVKMDYLENIERYLDPGLISSTTLDSKLIAGLITIVGVGLSCTVDSPNERITMGDVLDKLKSVRDDAVFQPTCIKKARV